MAIEASEQIWFDGRLIPWHKATIHVASHALHYGSSIFEGIRAYETPDGPAVFCLGPHLSRLYNSARIYRMEIPYTQAVLEGAVIDTIRANRHKACYIRPLVFRGAETLNVDPRSCPVQVAILTLEWGRYLGAEAMEQGVDVCVSSWRRMAPNTFPSMAKIGGQYINSQLIVMEAKERGFVEGIALDVDGFVSEGSGENVFVVRDGRILTPPLASSILDGITRQCAIELARDLGYEVRQERIPRELLYTADEVFFTGTAAEITPVRSVDGIVVGEGRRGPVTERLQAEFFGITSGRIADRHGWLRIVQ